MTLSVRRNSMPSIPKLICSKRRSASPIIPSIGSRSCCRGILPLSCQNSRQRKKTAKAESFVTGHALPSIAELIEDREITIGTVRQVGRVATAADEDCTYDMLVRRCGESLFQLLARLDQAIDKALTVGIFTDEINH